MRGLSCALARAQLFSLRWRRLRGRRRRRKRRRRRRVRTGVRVAAPPPGCSCLCSLPFASTLVARGWPVLQGQPLNGRHAQHLQSFVRCCRVVRDTVGGPGNARRPAVVAMVAAGAPSAGSESAKDSAADAAAAAAAVAVAPSWLPGVLSLWCRLLLIKRSRRR